MSRLSRVTEEKLARVDPIFPPSPPPPPHSQPLPWRPQAGISLRYPPFWRYFGLFFLPSTRGGPFCFCLPNPAVFFKKTL